MVPWSGHCRPPQDARTFRFLNPLGLFFVHSRDTLATMLERLNDEQASSLLRDFDGWFGPPMIQLRHGNGAIQTIDGRVRFRAAVAAKTTVPIRTVTTSGDAARILCIVGHYERAREFIPSELRDCRDVAAYCHCAPEIVSPLTRVRRPKLPTNSRTINTARRRDVIISIRGLIRQAENSDGLVSSDELRKALRAWL
jgi:hypothetical protein